MYQTKMYLKLQIQKGDTFYIYTAKNSRDIFFTTDVKFLRKFLQFPVELPMWSCRCVYFFPLFSSSQTSLMTFNS